MAVKLSEWKLKVSENAQAVLSKLNAAADKTSAKFAKFQDQLSGVGGNDFMNELPGASRGLDLFSNKAMLAGAAVAATGAVLYKSGELALNFEEGMAKINATAQLTQPELSNLKKELIGVGKDSAGNFERIPDAFEKINSQVNDVQKSLQILKVANKGAQAGFVDIDLAAGALAQTMSIVGNKANAQEVMDTLLKAKAVGAGEFQDFAQYLPQLMAAGSNLNIAYKDTAGLFAFMTAKGQSAADSAMLMQNAFTALGKSDIISGLKKGGVEVFNKDGSMRALDAVFEDLGKKLNVMTAEQKSNWLEAVGLKDAQAKNAFAVLAGDATKLKSIMADVRNSTGEMNKQLEMTDNYSRSWKSIGDDIKSWGVAIGDFVLPMVDALVQGITGLFRNIKNLTQQTYWQNFGEEEQLASKKSMAMSTSQNEAKKSFIEKFGQEAWGKAFTTEQKAFYDSKQKQLYSAIMGEKYQSSLNSKDPLKGVFDKSGKLVDFSPDKKKGKEIKSGIDNISGGGRSIRNIKVTIHKMVDGGINITSQTIEKGGDQIARQIEDLLLRAINGAELSLTNE
jgi:TP901 family phage tail tape measure protein